MSKTTPEEALSIAEKYYGACILRGEEVRWLEITPEKLAALIDEVRGVDAEPVNKQVGIVSGILGDICTIQLNGYSIRKGDKLYTHPAPSQPAALEPVEPEWIDDPHDIEQGLMRNPKWKPCEPAAPVELPVVGYVNPISLTDLADHKCDSTALTRKATPYDTALVKLSDAQAALAAVRKSS